METSKIYNEPKVMEENHIEKELNLLSDILKEVRFQCISVSEKLNYICIFPEPQCVENTNKKCTVKAPSPILEKISCLIEDSNEILQSLLELKDRIKI